MSLNRRATDVQLYRISFYHQSGRQFVYEAYCVGLDEVKAVVEANKLNHWCLNEVCCYESALQEFLYECYRMRVDA